MEQWNGLSLGRKLILGAGVLLLIDTFLHWQEVDVGPISAGQSGWHGFWGILLALMTIVLLLWVGARAFGVALPANVPDGLLTLALGVLIPLFALIKVLSDSFVHWPAWLGLILGLVVAAGAWLSFQESGESLPKIGPMSSSGAAAAPPMTPPSPEPEAPPEPTASDEPGSSDSV